MTENATFDLLLAYSFSRVHAYYLNVVRALSGRLRIGVHLGSPEMRSRRSHRVFKLERTERLFLEALREAGASLVDGPCQTGVLALPNNGLSEDHVRALVDTVRSSRTVAFECFGYGAKMLDVLLESGISRFYVFDKNIFEAKLDSRRDRDLAGQVEIVEMGSPCVAHPAFSMPEVDYIVALPTQLLLGGWRNRRRFLENMAALLRSIPAGDVVALKFHNVRDDGNRYFRDLPGRGLPARAGSRLAWAAADALERAPGGDALAAKFGTLANDLRFSDLRGKLLPLSSLTPRHNLNLELFLPHVRKGVITGISSCVWHALHAGLAVYNCDDQPFGDHLPNCSTYASFYVPPCGGRLEFDRTNLNKVSRGAATADLVGLLSAEAAACG